MSGQRKWTERRRKVFLNHLRATGNVTAAAEMAKISRSSAYALRGSDPGFRQAWDDAIEGALDDLEAELHRRAKEGTEKPIFYGGKPVGSVTSYSDNLAMFLLRSRRPHIYGDAGRAEDGPGRAREETAKAARRRLEEKLAAAEASENDQAEDGE